MTVVCRYISEAVHVSGRANTSTVVRSAVFPDVIRQIPVASLHLAERPV